MKTFVSRILIFQVLLLLPLLSQAQSGPATSKNQVAAWEAMKCGMFIHFNMNTFAGVEYDNGQLPASAFNPDKLDVDGWIRAARDGGMKYAVLTTKHTGGFCLWDSKVTWKGKEYDYDIASSPCKTDIVAEFMKACEKYQVKPALYYCLWDDHNQKGSTKEEYFQLTKGHITELVTNHRGLIEIWIDIPGQLLPAQRMELYNIVKTHQPGCLVTCNNGFTDGTVLYTFPTDITNGERTLPPASGHNPEREVNGKQYYIPMEVCQTINQNWFWIPDDVTKSVRTLYYLYDQTVKRGANLLLDVPPDRSGRMPESLARRLVELRKVIENPQLLPAARTLSAYKPVTSSSLWGGDRVEYLQNYAVDEDANTRWAADAKDPQPTLTVDLGDIKRFNSVVIMEPYEEHIGDYEVQYQLGNEWKVLFSGKGIGSYLHRQFPAVESRNVRLVVKNYSIGKNPANVLSFPNADAPVEGATISEFQVFNNESEDDPGYLNSFQKDREYFFLRSGKTKFILQSDQAGTLPAFTWMAFNANNPWQTATKRSALNYSPGSNFKESALQVILGNVAFIALPFNSEVRWIRSDSVPAVECSWWAGGVHVTETYTASDQPNRILRKISLSGADLMGNDTVRLRLCLPGGYFTRTETGMKSSKPAGTVELAVDGSRMPLSEWIADEENGMLESPLIPVAADGTTTLNTSLIFSFPADKSPDPDWNDEANPYNKLSAIQADDSLISSLYRSASFALPGMSAGSGRMDAGVFEYGNQWVRDGSNVAMGLIYSGAFESARSLLNYILADLVSDQGTTVIAGGFDEPDREEFDQMGVLMQCIKLFGEWTGDYSLVKQYSRKIIAMIERPLNPVFRDATGMVHNRREFWERTFNDSYELAYQTFMIQGLRDAADLSGILGVPEKAAGWRHEADIFQTAMLAHPTWSLVVDGALIKRRNVTGEVADLTTGRQPTYKNDAPVPTEYHHRLNPDATYALPVLFHIVDPSSPLARKSLDKLEAIWNARWTGGGYERYHSSSQIDQPGPWTFGTGFIARAQHEAGMPDRSRRSLQWLHDIQGGKSGAWFEEIPLNRSQVPFSGIVPWASAEVTSFVVQQWLGIDVVGNEILIRPRLYAGDQKVSANLRFREGFIRVDLEQKGKKITCMVNGRAIREKEKGVFAYGIK